MELAAGDYRLVLEPERGGSIARFDWRGEPLLRPSRPGTVLDVACFPLVPFSNRIAHGRFRAGGREIRLSPNLPGRDHPHPLHGFGWLAAWQVVERDATSALLEHRHGEGREWPWSYRARQRFELTPQGLAAAIEVQNLSASAMPAGLGFHPYFPRRADTRYRGLHRGEWRVSADVLPLWLDLRETAIDWWHGAPVGSRSVDTVYVGRVGPLEIAWPDRGIVLTIRPSDELSFTVVYTPADADSFCVEPVSHSIDAVNRAESAAELAWLARGETAGASMRLSAQAANTSTGIPFATLVPEGTSSG
jgi:aldose 1-epimerase